MQMDRLSVEPKPLSHESDSDTLITQLSLDQRTCTNGQWLYGPVAAGYGSVIIHNANKYYHT